MIENPVFIVGTERSGSNLLRLLLNELPEISIPHPPHLMRDLRRHVPRYGDLNYDLNFRKLIRDAIRLVDLHFAPWPLRLDPEQVFMDAPARDLYSVYAAIYDQYRRHTGKARWGCKSTFMIHHVDEILAHHKQPQFIHLVRDVRDVAVSARRSVFCHYHPYFVAELWRKEQAVARTWNETLPESTWFTLRYEDLIQDPEGQLRDVCAFLGSQYSPDLLRFFEKPAAQELSGLSRSWENVGKPVLKDNSEKYRTTLSEDEVKLIESVAGREMKYFGYRLNSEPTPIRLSPADRARFWLSEEWMMLKEEGKALLKDRNAKYRLRKKAFLWTLPIS